MAYDVIPETLGSVKDLEKQMYVLREEGELLEKRRTSLDEQMVALRKEQSVNMDLRRKTGSALTMARHLAEGKCAQLMRTGDTWHASYKPCPHKHKPDSRFCGTHGKRHQERAADKPVDAGDLGVM